MKASRRNVPNKQSADTLVDRKPVVHGKPDTAQQAVALAAHHVARAALYSGALAQLQRNPSAADAQDCPSGVPPGKDAICIRSDTLGKFPAPGGTTVIHRHIALLFGNDTYQDRAIPRLRTPVTDVKAVAQQLRSKFGYETRVVINASKVDFYRELNLLAGEARPEDSVIIMYAGHGYLLERIHMGFWLPADAGTDSAAMWVSNRDIRRFLRAIPARQILLVSDSCFSGSLTEEHKIKKLKRLLRSLILRQRTVTALSSGGDEPVADEGSVAGHSVFAGQMLHRLTVLHASTTGFELYSRVYRAVIREFPQYPQYGSILSAGDSGKGDYLIDVEAAPK